MTSDGGPAGRPDQADLDIPTGSDILVVDDQRYNLVAFDAALAPLGRNVVLAQSGAEALTKLLEHDFGLIVLDVVMPEFDGLETARLIRSRRRSRATPIIFITGATDRDGLMMKGYELGGVDFVMKPVQPEVLRAKVGVFLRLQERTLALRDAQQRLHDKTLARLYDTERDARQAAEIASARATFLSRASAQLGSSLDYEETLGSVARLAVPAVCTWCAIELAGSDHALRAVAMAHLDASKVDLVEELLRRRPAEDRWIATLRVMRSGAPELHAEISDPTMFAHARDNEQLRIAGELGIRSAILVPIRENDATIGVITFARSAASRRYDHDDLLMASQLGERVGAAITNARLYERAKDALALRDDFLSIAGHELRTPLTTMTLHLESLLGLAGESTLATVRPRIERIAVQVQRITRLVEDLLEVGRISSAQLELEPEELDLATLVTDVVAGFAVEAQRARTELVVDLEPTAGCWDRHRVEQIAINLIANALKYGRGKPIEIRLRPRDGAAVLAITDHGIGIDVKDQARIFDRFERAVSSREFGGLGLGLWIVRQLVDAHGGKIRVASRPGEGSTFTVLLPCEQPR